MSVRDIGNRGMRELFNVKKKLAIIAVSVAGVMFGFVLFVIRSQQ
ncbi:MAG TPA: hypothetical protein VJ599_10165 [Nitrososphaeraceae archaeon]|nr:hypothetical protein [Nitrososphaeraceae archaeon]